MISENWFKTLDQNLEIPLYTLLKINDRSGKIVSRLNDDFWGFRSPFINNLFVGSFGRGTAVVGVSDIDIVFSMPWSLYHQYDSYSGNGQSALLQAVRNSILSTYSRTNIRGDGQVVQVNFDDFKIEIVPAFENFDGSYWYPDTNNNGSWRLMNPRMEMLFFWLMDQITEGRYVKFCRMLRAWKSQNNVPISGMGIDSFVFSFFSTNGIIKPTYGYFDVTIKKLFAYIALQYHFFFAPGTSRLCFEFGSFQSRAKKAYKFAQNAIDSIITFPFYSWLIWRSTFGRWLHT